MIEYYFKTLFLGLFDAIGNNIDTALSNQISISAICIYATLYSVVRPFKPFCLYGGYYYRMYISKARACILWAYIAGTVLGVGMLISEPFIRIVFNTEPQNFMLLHRCLVIFAISRPFSYASSVMSELMIYDDKLKMASWMNIPNWIIYLILDVVAVVKYNSLEMVLASSLFCNISYCIIYEMWTNFQNRKFIYMTFMKYCAEADR